ncbi:hypothetical protein GQR58_001711 [Nymphon striatum]|nr:hypothetical protein GQR58_001711 [Nymphon striatum]
MCQKNLVVNQDDLVKLGLLLADLESPFICRIKKLSIEKVYLREEPPVYPSLQKYSYNEVSRDYRHQPGVCMCDRINGAKIEVCLGFKVAGPDRTGPGHSQSKFHEFCNSFTTIGEATLDLHDHQPTYGPCLDKEDLKNYRPVSNLSIVGKVIENLCKTCNRISFANQCPENVALGLAPYSPRLPKLRRCSSTRWHHFVPDTITDLNRTVHGSDKPHTFIHQLECYNRYVKSYQFQSVSSNSLGAAVKETKLVRGGDGGGGGGGGFMKLKNQLDILQQTQLNLVEKQEFCASFRKEHLSNQGDTLLTSRTIDCEARSTWAKELGRYGFDRVECERTCDCELFQCLFDLPDDFNQHRINYGDSCPIRMLSFPQTQSRLGRVNYLPNSLGFMSSVLWVQHPQIPFIALYCLGMCPFLNVNWYSTSLPVFGPAQLTTVYVMSSTTLDFQNSDPGSQDFLFQKPNSQLGTDSEGNITRNTMHGGRSYTQILHSESVEKITLQAKSDTESKLQQSLDLAVRKILLKTELHDEMWSGMMSWHSKQTERRIPYVAWGVIIIFMNRMSQTLGNQEREAISLALEYLHCHSPLLGGWHNPDCRLRQSFIIY